MCVCVSVCIYYTSGGRIYINVRRRSKYANLISDTIIFFRTRCRRRHRQCADEFVQKLARIICLSLSENGKLRTSKCGWCGTVYATFFIFQPAFIIYFFYLRAWVRGVNDVDKREGTSAKESLFNPLTVMLRERRSNNVEEKIIREPK